jgi:hypothetical protein
MKKKLAGVTFVSKADCWGFRGLTIIVTLDSRGYFAVFEVAPSRVPDE